MTVPPELPQGSPADEAIDGAIDQAAQGLVRHLVGVRLRCAVAESLTAGMVASALGSVPGSSNTLLGGVVAYAESIKMQLLRVPESVLLTHGAVSAECAIAMAHGVLAVTGADVALATTGVAGPGPWLGHPAGETYLAWVWGQHVGPTTLPDNGGNSQPERIVVGTESAARFVHVERHLFSGTRHEVRRQATFTSLARAAQLWVR